MDRADVRRRVGSMRQAGGVQLVSLEEGMERGVRVIEFNTGTGFRFGVCVDRGMDVTFCEQNGASLAWMPPKGFVSPTHFEGGRFGWLRMSGLGGLFNTCGLVTIGGPYEVDTAHYRFPDRKTDYYGIHDRIGITPAARFTFGEGWDGDRYVLWAEGTVRQEIEYGENLTLHRRYETELGASSFSMVDTVTNEGGFDTPHQMLYHINIGWPVVDQDSELLTALAGPPPGNLFGVANFDPEAYRRFTAPEPQFVHQGYELDLARDGKGWSGAAVINRGFDNGRGLGAFVRYDANTLPMFIEWRMMREQLYAVGMEPASNTFGSLEKLKEAGVDVILRPGETKTYRLEMGALSDTAAIDAFAAAMPKSKKGR
jgi:hypothetical protein